MSRYAQHTFRIHGLGAENGRWAANMLLRCARHQSRSSLWWFQITQTIQTPQFYHVIRATCCHCVNGRIVVRCCNQMYKIQKVYWPFYIEMCYTYDRNGTICRNRPTERPYHVPHQSYSRHLQQDNEKSTHLLSCTNLFDDVLDKAFAKTMGCTIITVITVAIVVHVTNTDVANRTGCQQYGWVRGEGHTVNGLLVALYYSMGRIAMSKFWWVLIDIFG